MKMYPDVHLHRSADEIIVVCASKVTQLGVLRSTHFSKTKSRQAKNNYVGTNFLYF
jgi:hypothetical protein